jgi:hypothetical protein
MILLAAILFILAEAITEGLIKRHSPAVSAIIFKWWVQWIIAVVLFGIWLVIALQLYYVPIVKLIIGFIFVRFLVFDVVWNIVRGVKWNYYGTTKLYDRIMIRLGSFGWFIKAVAGIVGIVFLMGWS